MGFSRIRKAIPSAEGTAAVVSKALTSVMRSEGNFFCKCVGGVNFVTTLHKIIFDQHTQIYFIIYN
jgi:hypothetical protein